MAHFQVIWREHRKQPVLPQLKVYPETPSGYYDGYYPGSILAISNQTEFKSSLQRLSELNTFWAATVTSPLTAYLQPITNRISFKCIRQDVELNEYPATPAGYYSGYYPGSILAESSNSRFKVKKQALLKLDSYPATPVFIGEPITAWLPHFEYTKNLTNRHLLPVKANILAYDTINFACSFDFQIGLLDINVLKQFFVTQLDASISIGLFRLFDELTSDRLSFITQINIHMLNDAPETSYDDWMDPAVYAVDVIEDWLALAESVIDWGDAAVLTVQYTPEIYSSFDGSTPDTSQDSDLSLVKTEGKMKIFSCYSTGLYHLIKIDASNVDDNFSLKALDLTINLGGRI